MIKELSIQNFQSHKDTSLEFHKGVNIVVGSSDSGKTAILRALRWLIWNRPSGDSMRSNWGGKTSVELFTDDCHIVRSKDKESKYILGDTHFKAFSTDVPQEIQDALNVSDINLQQQHDQPFLLTETPGNVAQHFNKVARLDKIDSGLQNVQKEIRQLEQDIKYKGSQISSQEESLQAYLHLDKFEAEVEALEAVENALQAKESSRKRLSGYIITYKDITEGIKEQEEVIKDEELVNFTLQLVEDRAELDVKQVKLEKLTIKIKKVKEDIQEFEQVLSLEEQVENTFKLVRKKNALIMENDPGWLSRLIQKIIQNNKYLEFEELSLKNFMITFNREMPDVCPLCGSKIPHNHETI